MASFSTAAGLSAALLAHRVADQKKALTAIVAGVSSWALAALLSKVSRALVGLERERGDIEEWAEQYDEDAVEPELRILDAHHHLWDFRTQPKGVPTLLAWLVFLLKPKALSAMLRTIMKPLANSFGFRVPIATPFMGAELTKDIRGNGRGHKVVGTLYMECGWHEATREKCMAPAGEVDMVMGVNRQYPQLCQGIVAHADLSLGADVEPLLKIYGANPMVKGVRDALACPRDPSLMPHASEDKAYGAKFREGFALLEKYNLTYDSWHYHVDLDAFTDLARTFPRQRMICDHMGYPLGIGSYSREASFPQWKEKMSKLAELPNVYVKVGGFGMRFPGFGFDERPTPPSSDELAEAWGPYVRYTIEVFGVDRCMMESNFPMDKISCSYTVLFNALKKIVAGRSEEDKRKLFELNASRVYGLP